MKAQRTFLNCLLSFLLVFAGPASLVGFAQEDGPTPAGVKNTSVPFSEPGEQIGFIIRRVNGVTVCLDATPEELRLTQPQDPGVPLTQLNHLAKDQYTPSAATRSGGTTSEQAAAGLKIILRGTEQLNANPQVAAAFVRAAAVWESLITSDITVVIDVDYGVTRFGTAYEDEDILGSTSGGVFFIPSYSSARSRLIGHASSAEEAAVYSALPNSATLPTDLGPVGQVAVASPIARALNVIPTHANPNPTPDPNGPGGKSLDALGNAPSIGLNASFNFDFNPDDGISPGMTDFNAVAVHEIGHALGFTSQVGHREVNESSPLRVAVWDLFRFRPGTAQGALATAQRILSSGGEHVHFDGAGELGLSTGRPDGTLGDKRQASHWKDDRISGEPARPYIGIMDPTINAGVRREMTNNDRRTVDFFGYQVGAGAPPPANDNFANATALNGPAGALSGTTSGATEEAGERDHVGNKGGRSVWFRWTAPATGRATFDTVGSSFDTLLAVYKGDTALALVVENDDIVTAQDTDSRVGFDAVAGTTYHIVVDGFDGEAGLYTLNWTAPGGPGTTPTPNPSATLFQFVSPTFSVNEYDRSVGIVVTRTGDASAQQAVTFKAVGTPASGLGTMSQLIFLPGETYKIASVTFDNDQDVEPSLNVNLSLETPSPGAQLGAQSTAILTILDDDTFPANMVQFAGAALQNVGEGAGKIDLTVTRSALSGGDLSRDAYVSYSTHVSVARDTHDFSLARGTLHFAPGETTKTFSVLITEDAIDEPDETFNVQLSNPLGTRVLVLSNNLVTVNIQDNDAQNGPNPSDDPASFVRQHYMDFLNRVPDDGGLAFWTNEIASCAPNAQCAADRRQNVSAAFFLSIEYRDTGYLVYRTYKAAYGDMPGAPVPIRIQELIPDTQQIGQGVAVGTPGWAEQMNANKRAFLNEFVTRGRFKTAHPQGLSPAQFVDRLNANTGGVLTQGERDALVAELTADNSAAGRAVVLGKVAENAALASRELNKAFVLMQYMGYLRRNPNEGPDSDFRGYQFWLGKLEDNGGNFVQAQMVQAFIDSIEYRNRFAL